MPQKIDEHNVDNLLQGISIPAQPQILVDIQMETAMPGFSLTDIAKLIAKDVGLSGSILKIVNSPYFGLSNQITSIQQAINLLGMDSVINIIHSVEIRNTMSDDSVIALTEFWDNAADVAQTCAVISKRISFSAPDDAYTLGLFHNCGIPLMMQRYDDYIAVLETGYQQSTKRITDIENETFGSNHAVVGFYVAKSWKLPKTICEVIADHHKITEVFAKNIGDTRQKTLLAILSLSSHLCSSHIHIGKSDQDFEFENVRDIVLHYMGLTSLDLEDLKDDIVELGILN